jgi:hypothetical protein
MNTLRGIVKTLIVSLLLLVSGAYSANADVVFSSRNMPQSCSLVFMVESDLKISLPLETQETELSYELQNSWTPFDWSAPKILPLEKSVNDLYAAWSFQSMNINENYLYRNIRIVFPKSKIVCTSEFGRQFGEACTGSRESTPWRRRVLVCEGL